MARISLYKTLILCVLLGANGLYNPISAQTCCSGGVPLTGNMGFANAQKGSLQLELKYDVNYLNNLKMETESIEENSRTRLTHSLLLNTGISITDFLAVDALFSYVNQNRYIRFLDNVNAVDTHGFGDAIVLVKLVSSGFANRPLYFQLGAGPKIPLGKSDITDERGISYNADMQPGSGAWSFLYWGYGAWTPANRPYGLVSSRIVVQMNGVNNNYLQNNSYQYGNTFQGFIGYSDQVLLGQLLFNTSIQLQYRQVAMDRISDVELINTGGQWLYLSPGISWQIQPNMTINLLPEIPLYGRVNGIQLSPTFRFQIGMYFQLDTKKNEPAKFL